MPLCYSSTNLCHKSHKCYNESTYNFWNIYSNVSPALSKTVHTQVTLAANVENVITCEIIQGKHIKTKQDYVDTVIYLLSIHLKILMEILTISDTVTTQTRGPELSGK